MKHASAGSILLYGVLALLVLGAIAFGMQALVLPNMTVGLSSLENAQADALEQSFKNVIRQQLGKNSGGAKLLSTLMSLQDKPVVFRNTAGENTGTVKARFTVSFLRSGATPSSRLTLPSGLDFPKLTGEHDMLAVSDEKITRFTYDFSANSTKDSALIPKDSGIYFLLSRKDGADATKATVTYRPKKDNTPASLVCEKLRLPVTSAFAEVLPPTEGLIGLISAHDADPAKITPDKRLFSLVYNRRDGDEFKDVGIVYGKETSLSSMPDDKRLFEVALGQHVLAKLTLTLPSGTTVSRVWRFNGVGSLAENDTWNYHKDVTTVADDKTLADYVSEFAPVSGTPKWAKLGDLETLGTASYGWNGAVRLKPTAYGPDHELFLCNKNGNNDTTLRWARFILNDPVIAAYGDVSTEQPYGTVLANTSYKLSYCPYVDGRSSQNAFTSGEPYSFFGGLVLRANFDRNNPDAGGQGLAIGLSSGSIELGQLGPDFLDMLYVKDNGYAIDPALLPGFIWSHTIRCYVIPQWNAEHFPNSLGYAEKENGVIARIVLPPRVLLWRFDDFYGGNTANPRGNMEILAVGKPELPIIPHYKSNTSPSYTSLHVNLEEVRTESGDFFNEIRAVLATPDFEVSRWISMEMGMKKTFHFLNDGNDGVTTRVPISWIDIRSPITYLVPNDYRPPVPMTITADEPQYILRTGVGTGSVFRYGAIYSSVTPLGGLDQVGYARDFGLAVTVTTP